MDQPQKIASFSVALGEVDGKTMIVFGSTIEPPVGHHNIVVVASEARNLADRLKAMADHIDPPQKQWQVVGEKPLTVERAVDALKEMVRKPKKRPANRADRRRREKKAKR